MPLFAASTLTSEFPLHPVDVAIVAVYLLAMVAIGVWVGRGQHSTTAYFLGDRSLPWWAVLLSIVATETSTVTFLSIPGKAYVAGGDMRFLQITFGYITGRLMVVALLLPLYFRGEPFTAYEVLQRRFGKVSRRATSLLFLVTRNLSDALRLYLSALVLHTAMGLGLQACIVVMGLVTIFYTYVGGVKSVVWNDCVQFVIYIAGAMLALYGIVHALPGGVDQFLEFGRETGRFRVFDFDWNLEKPSMTFWAGLIGGTFLTAATHGTDQLTVQRLLSARSQRGAALALGASGVVIFLQFALFLIIGVALACFYATTNTGAAAEELGGDRVFAHFIVHYLPVGLVGLTLAAVFAAAMSTLSGSFNSSATALVNDLVVPLRSRPMSAEAQLRLGKLATGGFGLLQVGIALVSYHVGASSSVVESVLTIAAFASGPMLGLYLLAVLTRVGERAALCGFLGGLVFLSYLRLEHPLVAFPWYSAFGSAVTLAVGLLASLALDKPSRLDANLQ
jgi:solute:Na+ symporter, SSS family